MTDLRLDQFEQLETAMWNSLVDGDGDAAGRLLSSDYLGVYTTGFSGRDDYIAALANGPIAASFEISQSQMFVLSDTEVLYSYRADFKSQKDGPAEAMYISSLWCLRDDRWVNVFSQDTPSEESRSSTGTAP
ncbi:MAG: nuclear transport factor 2 family protein [Actinobacteria bacterium]|nr:MAG: nuclear transport factor 2 family protein [Actinomycetota bacterium]